MTIGTRLVTWLTGKYIGEDAQGNRYYTSRAKRWNNTPRRWVIYQGAPEPSRVPAMWHAWLHYMTDDVPEKVPASYDWQQEKAANMTGTPYAYFPPGYKGGQREQATGDYVSWDPKD